MSVTGPGCMDFSDLILTAHLVDFPFDIFSFNSVTLRYKSCFSVFSAQLYGHAHTWSSHSCQDKKNKAPDYRSLLTIDGILLLDPSCDLPDGWVGEETGIPKLPPCMHFDIGVYLNARKCDACGETALDERLMKVYEEGRPLRTFNAGGSEFSSTPFWKNRMSASLRLIVHHRNAYQMCHIPAGFVLKKTLAGFKVLTARAL